MTDFLERKYKHIFVDFDSTLYLWDNHPDRKDMEPVKWNALQLSRDGRRYDPKYINKLLIEYLQRSGAEIHLSTSVNLSCEAESKFNFINKYYSNLLTDYIGISDAEQKICLLQAYEYEGNSKNSMLMIDDNYIVVSSCRAAGFDVQEPQFVMGMVYEAKTKEQALISSP